MVNEPAILLFECSDIAFSFPFDGTWTYETLEGETARGGSEGELGMLDVGPYVPLTSSNILLIGFK
jgi:hypothetical protein